MSLLTDFAHRHPAVVEKLAHFGYEHLREDLQPVSAAFHTLIDDLLRDIKTDGPQLTIALQRLIEAKDAAVRAKVAEVKADPVAVVEEAAGRIKTFAEDATKGPDATP